MTEIYSGSEWHYTEGKGIDLHHAMLGQDFEGGIAFVGTICRPDGGFGVSTGIRGNIDLSVLTFWDIYVVMHEIG